MVRINYEPARDQLERNKRLISNDPKADFIEYIYSKGYDLCNQPIAHGHITRFLDHVDLSKGKTDPNKGAGWCTYYEVDNEYDSVPLGIGIISSFHDESLRETWTSKSHSWMTIAERDQTARYIRKAAEDAAVVMEEEYRNSAIICAKIWNEKTREVRKDHPYIVKKKITPYGARELSRSIDYDEELFSAKIGDIIVPILDKSYNITSLQRISDDGSKLYKKFGRISGCFLKIEGDDSNIFICEGWATGCTIRKATGCTTYVAYSSKNLIKIAPTVKEKHGSANIVFVADNDTETEKEHGFNPGIRDAESASSLIGASYIVSPVPSDVNDMAISMGEEAVKQLLMPAPKKDAGVKQEEEQDAEYKHLYSPPGVMGLMVNYYMATAKSPQPWFAVQYALASCSVAIGRQYRTCESNYSSMFFANIAGTGFGKAYGIDLLPETLVAWDMEECISSGGHNSIGSIYTQLCSKPRHIAMVDEFGIYLKGMRENMNGHQSGVNRAMLNVITVCDGVFNPPAYSAGALAGTEKAKDIGKVVKKPAMSFIGVTTPRTFFDAISGADVDSGMLNRFITVVIEGHAPKKRRSKKMPLPDEIIEWGKKINARAGHQIHSFDTDPYVVEIPFHDECDQLLDWLDDYERKRGQELEVHGLEGMVGRIREWSMRLSLICALSENTAAKYIEKKHLEWSKDYIIYHNNSIIKHLLNNLSESQYDADRKELLNALKQRNHSNVKVDKKYMHRNSPFRKWPTKYRNELLNDLTESGLIYTEEEESQDGANKRKTEYYYTQ